MHRHIIKTSGTIINFFILYHQLTRGHKVLRGIQHAIAASNSFEISPVFLRSFSLLCHTVCSLKLFDPKEPDLRAVQGQGAQDYRRVISKRREQQKRPKRLAFRALCTILTTVVTSKMRFSRAAGERALVPGVSILLFRQADYRLHGGLLNRSALQIRPARQLLFISVHLACVGLIFYCFLVAVIAGRQGIVFLVPRPLPSRAGRT